MDELEKYYQYLKSNGADVPSNYNSFRTTLSDSATANQYYNYLKQNQFDVPDNFDSFRKTFNIGYDSQEVKQQKQPAIPGFMDIGSQTQQTIQTAQQNIPKVQQQPITKPKQETGVFDASVIGQEVKPTAPVNKGGLPIGVAVGKDKKKEGSTLGGIYNTLVGSISRAVGGLVSIAELVEPLLPGTQPAKLTKDGKPITSRQLVEGTIDESLRSKSSTIEQEQARKQFDFTNGVSASDVEAIMFQAPSQLLDMTMGALTNGASFLVQAVNDNAKELEQNPDADKLGNGGKLAYVYTQALAQAALDKFGLDRILKGTGLNKAVSKKVANEITDELIAKGGKATAKEVQDLAIKKASQLSSKIKKVGLGTAIGVGIEGGTEGLQEATSKGIKLLTNKIAGNEIFDEKDIRENFIKDVINSTVAGGAFGGMFGGGSATLINTNKSIRRQIAQANKPEDLQKIADDINTQIEQGNLTPQEGEQALAKAQQYTEIATKIPAEIDEETKYDVIGGIDQRNGLQAEIDRINEELKSVDPAFAKQKQDQLALLQDKLSEVNDYIQVLVTGEKPKYAERNGKYFKIDPVTDEETEITKGHYELANAADLNIDNPQKRGEPEEISQPIELEVETEIQQQPTPQVETAIPVTEQKEITIQPQVVAEETITPNEQEEVVNYEDAIKITPTSELSNPELYGTDELGMEAKTAALRDEEKTPPIFKEYKTGTYAKDRFGDLYQLQEVPIENIILPEGEQKRESTISKYKKWYKKGSKFPPAKGVENYAVYNGKVVVNDGHHRVVAAKQLGLKTIPVWVSLTDPKNPARPITDINYHKSLQQEITVSKEPLPTEQQTTVSESEATPITETPKVESKEVTTQQPDITVTEPKVVNKPLTQLKGEKGVNESMPKFNYQVLQETEKAVKAKIPYWEETSDSYKKNKQLFYEAWIPKSVIAKGDSAIKDFVINERDKKRLSNPYQKSYKTPNSWKTMGEIAPQKDAKTREVVDEDKVKQLIDKLKEKYNTTSIDKDMNAGIIEMTPEDEKLFITLRFRDSETAKKNQQLIPKKTETYYENKKTDITEPTTTQPKVEEGGVGALENKTFITHKNEVVSGNKLADAVNKVADNMVESAKKKRKEYYASHITEKQKDAILAKDLKYAEEVRQGEHLNNLTIAQRINYELTGESVPILPKEQSKTTLAKSKVESKEVTTQQPDITNEVNKQIKQSQKWEQEMFNALDEYSNPKNEAQEKEATKKINKIREERRKRDIELFKNNIEDENYDEVHDAILTGEDGVSQIPKGYTATVIDSYYEPILGRNHTIVSVKNNKGQTFYIDVNTYRTVEIGKVYDSKITEPTTTQPIVEEVKSDLGTKARDLAAKVRSGEKQVLPDWLQASLPKGTKKQGIDINEAFAKALETFADIYDTTKDFAQAVEQGFKNIKDWFDENKVPYNEAELKEKFAQDRQGEIPTESQPPPPSEPPVSEQGEGKGFRHADTEKIRERSGLEPYQKIPETIQGWIDEARQRIKDGYNVEALLNRVEKGVMPDAVEQNIIGEYLMYLDEQVKANPSDENIAKLKRVVEISDKVGGSEIAKSLVARRGSRLPDDSLGNFFIQQMEATGANVLTENQKQVNTKEFEEIQAANNEYKEKVKILEEEVAKLKAQKEIDEVRKKSQPSKTKKTHEDYVKERQDIIKQMREDLLKVAKGSGGLQSSIPGAAQLKAIAPHVGKLVKSLVDENYTKLEEVVKLVYNEVKDIVEGITEKDIQNIIAGDYSEKKQTRSNLAETLRDLKTEAKLLGELEKLQNGVEPKVERQKQIRNKRITDLQNQIKELRKQQYVREKEFDKFYTEDLYAEFKKLAALRKRTESEIAEVEEKIKKGDFAPEERKPLLLNPELKKKYPEEFKKAVEAKDKLIKLKQEREIRLLKEKYANRTKYQKIQDAVVEVSNVPRAIMASVDFSAPLRQGIITTVAYPTISMKAAVEMFKQAFSQKAFDRWFYDVKEHPRYELAKKSTLHLADPHDPKLSAKEEQFMSNLAEKIPVIGRLVKGSERAYIAFLNKVRWDVFNRMADAYESEGKTFENSEKLYRETGDYINTVTGRGTLGKFEESAQVLNAAFFSPRLIASRVKLLTNFANPNFYYNVPKEVRVQYFKDMAKFLGAGLSVLTLAKLYQEAFGSDEEDEKVTVEVDPRSSDFGKIKVGNTRYDIWGGFQPYVRLMAQMFTGQRKTTTTGEIQNLQPKQKFQTASNFFRGKLAPVPASGVDIITGENVTGDRVQPLEELTSMLIPLTFQDLSEAIKDKGVSAIFTTGIPSTFGIGTQTYTNTSTLEGLYDRNLTSKQTMDINKITKYENGFKKPITKDEFKKFTQKRDSLIQEGLDQLYKNGQVYVKNREVIKKSFEEMTPIEVQDEIKKIKTSATKKAKEELFPIPDKIKDKLNRDLEKQELLRERMQRQQKNN